MTPADLQDATAQAPPGLGIGPSTDPHAATTRLPGYRPAGPALEIDGRVTPPPGDGVRRLVPAMLLALATLAAEVVAGGGFSAGQRLGVRSVAGHAVLETVIVLIVTLAAAAFVSRVRRGARGSDLALACALAMIAASRVVFSVLPAIAPGLDVPSVEWAGLVGGLLAWLVMLAALLGPRRLLERPGRAAAVAGIASAAALAALVALTYATDLLGPSAGGPSGWTTADQPAAVAIAGVTALVAAICALVLCYGAENGGGRMLRWLGAASGFAAVAALDSAVVTTATTTSTIGPGDLLRACFAAALLAGLVNEISGYVRDAGQRGAVRERRRVAADIHDLVLQDLCLALANARMLEGTEAGSVVVQASERALVAARALVNGLVRVEDLPLGDALLVAIGPAVQRRPVRVRVRVPGAGVDPRPGTRDALIGIAREAVTNAVKHAQPASIEVSVGFRDDWRLTVSDDGSGFDPARPSPGFGMTSMHDRATAAGGDLWVRSRRGDGTVVEAVLP